MQRTLKDLYQILLDEFDTLTSEGICGRITELESLGLISYNEIDELHKHFKNNKPKFYKHRKFYKHPTYTGSTWWWIYGKESQKQRKLFIQHLISKLK